MAKLIVLSLFLVYCNNLIEGADIYHNPLNDNEYKECNIKEPSNLCDSDSILTESKRDMLITKLEKMNSTTIQENDPSFCQTKGLSVVIVLQKHVGDGTQKTVEDKSNELLQKWNLDPKCNKTMVMLVATEDHKFWAARGNKFPLTGAEITAIFMQQKKNLASGDYAQALENILDSIINKNQQLSTRDTTINQPATTTELIYTSKTEPEQKSPGETISISPTVLIILIIVIILLIVCCVCCCIVSKMSNICSGRGSSSMFPTRSYDVQNRRTYVNSYPTYVNSNPTPVFDQGGGGDFSSSNGGDKGGGGDFSSSSGGDKGGGGDFSSSSGGDKGGGGDFSSSSGGDKGGGGGGDFSSGGGGDKGDKGGGGGW